MLKSSFKKFTTVESEIITGKLVRSSIIYIDKAAKCHSYLPPVTPLLDRGKNKPKNRRVFLEKSDQGPQIPGTEKLTPLPIQEPQDYFDFSDPTNDLLIRMQR